MHLLGRIREKAKQKSKRIVLPESEDVRVLKSARDATSLGIGKIILIGEEEKIKGIAASNSIKLDGVDIVNPLKSGKLEKYAEEFFRLRKHKGITEEEAKDIVTKSALHYAALMTRMGDADGFVAGAVEKSSTVVKAAIYCIGVDKSAGTISSAFVINIDGCPYGEKGAFIFADCAVVPNPSSRQLAGIAYSSAKLFRFLFEKEPIVAMLSFSTKGSAEHPLITKVTEAVRIAKELYPDLTIDGELQLDSAVDKDVAKKKCPGSPVGGRANVLVFPDLNCGNIGYKLIDRLAGGRAVGPLMQGLAKPCSDLSRGCSSEDIVDAIAITAIRGK